MAKTFLTYYVNLKRKLNLLKMNVNLEFTNKPIKFARKFKMKTLPQ